MRRLSFGDQQVREKSLAASVTSSVPCRLLLSLLSCEGDKQTGGINIAMDYRLIAIVIHSEVSA